MDVRLLCLLRAVQVAASARGWSFIQSESYGVCVRACVCVCEWVWVWSTNLKNKVAWGGLGPIWTVGPQKERKRNNCYCSLIRFLACLWKHSFSLHFQHWLEVSGQHQASAALPSGKLPTVPFMYEVGWTPEEAYILTWWRRLSAWLGYPAIDYMLLRSEYIKFREVESLSISPLASFITGRLYGVWDWHESGDSRCGLLYHYPV
jgi:hypothetical protein